MSKDAPLSPVDAQGEVNVIRDSLRLAAAGVATPGTSNVFRELVKHLAIALDVDHAFIGVLKPGRQDTVHVISGYFFRQFNDGFDYDLKDTPCENVIGQQFRFYPERVQELFADPHVRELETEGYAGIPLYDSRGGVLGLMAVANRRPLHDRSLTEDLLKIFSVRAAVELERRYSDQACSEKEQELRKSEDRLRATVEAASDCIIAMDRDGRVIEFNPAAEQCFGYAKSDSIGKSLAELIIPARFRQGHEKGMATFRKTGEGDYLGKRVEVTALRADGSEFPAELSLDVAQGAEGEIFIGYIRDITERREAEEQRQRLEKQLRQAQKMEAIGQLTGGIAHDFNNILTAMTGYVVLARERVESLGDEKLSRYLERAQRSGQRASDLIQQMLTFSRGQHGEPRPVSLAALIREWIGLLETTLPSSVEIRTALDPQIPLALVDPVQIEQVLMNLCINARDAMQGHGALTISLHNVAHRDSVCASCRQPVAGEYIEIAVRDTGPGVPPEVQERMFEPFYTTKAVGHGSGMGLSMVHGIIHEHGGHLLLDSRPGEGAALRILLAPLSAGETGEETAEVADIRPDRHRIAGRVLLVDDEPAVSEFMQDLLEEWGLTVSVFNSSVDACGKFSDAPDLYDLVILDHTMPRMTGLEVAKHVLKLRPDLPVVLYTGYSEEISEDRVSQAGIRALVRKPVDTHRLRDLIWRLLSGSALQ
jgi:two-component system cell cycle sensor histidine kinase/response regulator CckA